MADSKSRGIDLIKLCRNKPLSDAQRSSAIALIKDGADLNARYGPGNTALHYASEKGHAEIVKELLASGADPRCPNDEGKTPVDFAQALGLAAIVKVLEASAAKKKVLVNMQARALRPLIRLRSSAFPPWHHQSTAPLRRLKPHTPPRAVMELQPTRPPTQTRRRHQLHCSLLSLRRQLLPHPTLPLSLKCFRPLSVNLLRNL